MHESTWPTAQIEAASKDGRLTFAAAAIIAESDYRPADELGTTLADMLAEVAESHGLEEVEHVQAALFMAAPSLGMKELFIRHG